MANLQIAPVDSLDSFQADKKKKQALLKETVAQRATEHGVLLVRVDDMPSRGERGSTLTDRQKRWLNATPYDSTTQNPVLYKYVKESCKLPRDVMGMIEAREAVQSLSDTIVAPPPSGIGNKISKRRKERHQQLVKEMEEELSVICSEMEDRIKMASEKVHTQLAENDKVIEEMFNGVGVDEILRDLNIANLEELWDEVVRQSVIREEFIEQLDATLNDVEEDRTQQIEKLLLDYSDKMKQAAYLLAEDVERLVEGQGLSATLAIVGNKKSYVELCAHLKTTDCIREKQQHKQWLSLVEDWKQLLYRNAFTTFTQFMENREITSPDEMRNLKGGLTVEQKNAGYQRKELMDQILNLKPPMVNPAHIYEWREATDRLYEDLDAIHSKFLLKLQQCLDSTQRSCEDEMERLRKHLTSSGAFESYKAYELMCKDFLPLIDQHSKKMREDLQALERGLDVVITTQKDQFSEVYQFVQEVVLLWNDQKNVIDQLQRNYEENLEKHRMQHDKANQNLEANLDVVLDRLRQGPTPEALKQYKNEALKMLDVVKAGYSTFQNTIIHESKKLPSSLEPDLKFYNSALCQHLQVTKHEDQARPSQSKKRIGKKLPSSKSSSPKKTSSKFRISPANSPNAPKIIINIHNPASKEGGEADEEVIYLCFTEDEENKMERRASANISPRRSKKSGTFLTQDEDMESAHVALATENLVLAGGAFTQVKHGIRVNFLEHLEHWKRDIMRDAAERVAEKEEAAKTELDLRLHLHQPRPSRVLQDIHDVRAAELLVHSERMDRHVQGVVVSIQSHRDTIDTLADQLSKQSESFLASMSTLKFTEVLNGRDLSKIKAKGDKILAKHSADIDSIVAEFNESSDERLQEINASNDSYKSSLKLFQEGGNYCPEEIELFEKKMDRIHGKIASTKLTLGKDVNNLAKTHQQMLTDTTSHFMIMYHTYSADISFSESLSKGLVSVKIAVKSEMAASNTKAKAISDKIAVIQDQISEAAEKKLLPLTIETELIELTALLSKRAEHLYCYDRAEDDRAGTISPVRVSFDEGTGDSKNPLSVVNVAKNILESTATATSPKKKPQATGDIESSPKLEQHLSKSSLPANKTGTMLKASSRSGAPGDSISAKQARASSRRRQSIQVDRREYASNLGTAGGSKATSFLPKVRFILRARYYELFDLVDEFYNKGMFQAKDVDGTPITHMQTLKGSAEECLVGVEEKVTALRVQAEECRQDSIEEFQEQLKTLVPLLLEYVFLSSEEFRGTHEREAREVWQQDKKELLEELKKSHIERKQHESRLQPTLGRPGKEEEFAELCSLEEKRHEAACKLIAEHTQNFKEKARKNMLNFLQELGKMVKSLLHAMDAFIYPSEITDFKPKVKTGIEDLLRSQVAETLPFKIRHTRGSASSARARASTRGSISSQQPNKKVKGKAITSKSVQWPCFPPFKLELLSPVKKSRVNSVNELMKEKLISRKSTRVHEEVVQSRDQVFEEMMIVDNNIMEEMNKTEEAELLAEQRWIDCWRNSVDNIKQLYAL